MTIRVIALLIPRKRGKKLAFKWEGGWRKKEKGSSLQFIFPQHTKGWQDLKLHLCVSCCSSWPQTRDWRGQVGATAETKVFQCCAFCTARAKATWLLVVKLVTACPQVLLLNHNYPVRLVPLYACTDEEMRIEEIRG